MPYPLYPFDESRLRSLKEREKEIQIWRAFLEPASFESSLPSFFSFRRHRRRLTWEEKELPDGVFGFQLLFKTIISLK